MQRALKLLNPKMYALDSATPPVPVVANPDEINMEAQVKRINESKFTSKGDHPKVVQLYQDYVSTLAETLQDTLALVAPIPPTPRAVSQLRPLPVVNIPPVAPLHLAAGQVLLLVSAGETQFGVVDASGRRVQRTLSGGDTELVLDACAQAVVPWRPLGAGWGDALLRDVEGMRSLDGRLLRTQARSLAPPYEEGLRALGVVAASVVEAAARQSTIKAVAVEAGAAVRFHIEKAVAATVEEQKRVASGSLADTGKLEVQVEAVRTAVARLHPEALAAAALHTSGGVGARMYAAGQKLTVRHVGGWHDAEVGKGGVVWLEGGRTVDLHPWNHAPLELPSDGFEKVRDWHLNSLRVQHSHIIDALSGQRLDSLQQLVAIDVKGGSSSAVRDASTLSVWLRKLHEERVIGGALETPPAVLLTAGPAAGKTTLLSQLVVLALDGELVPVLVKVQRLQRLLVDAADSFAHA